MVCKKINGLMVDDFLLLFVYPYGLLKKYNPIISLLIWSYDGVVTISKNIPSDLIVHRRGNKSQKHSRALTDEIKLVGEGSALLFENITRRRVK